MLLLPGTQTQILKLAYCLKAGLRNNAQSCSILSKPEPLMRWLIRGINSGIFCAFCNCQSLTCAVPSGSFCGNSLVENNEECDVGAGRADKCCNGQCRLKPGAKCRYNKSLYLYHVVKIFNICENVLSQVGRSPKPVV